MSNVVRLVTALLFGLGLGPGVRAETATKADADLFPADQGG
jgi:hypothetical protein